MTIKLEKTEELNGDIYFRVWVDGCCNGSFMHDPDKKPNDVSAEERAKQYYDKVIERHKQGYPKKETILSETIESTP